MEWRLSCGVVFAGILTAAASAEFRVNTETTYAQSYPDIATAGNQGFVAVWRSYRQDGDSGGIFAQRLDAAGQRLGNEFQVNESTAGDQTEPAVAADAGGGFAVVWRGPGADGLDEEIYIRRYDLAGAPLGAEVTVNSITAGNQSLPRIAMNADGMHVVVWQNENPEAGPYERGGSLQVFDSAGGRLAGELQFNADVDCRYPDVAMGSHGNFVVAWLQDRPHNAIQIRLYDASGIAKTAPMQVNQADFGSVTKPSVAIDGMGNFVVAWDGHEQYSALDDIHARIFDANGVPITDQFLVNMNRQGEQEDPSVAVTSQGIFTVTWYSDNDHPRHEKDVFGRMFNCEGQAIGPEFCPHVWVAEDQKYPAVTMTESDRFLAIWQSYKQDGSNYGIYGMLGPSTIAADLTGDGLVNFRDFAKFAAQWHLNQPGCREDFNDDGTVSQADAQILFELWLEP